jgi:hypothetical protein
MLVCLCELARDDDLHVAVAVAQRDEHDLLLPALTVHPAEDAHPCAFDILSVAKRDLLRVGVVELDLDGLGQAGVLLEYDLLGLV